METEPEPKHPGGRPSKRTPEITDQICEAISYGLTDEEVAALVGIDDSTLTRWKKDPQFCGAIKRAVAKRKLDRLKRIERAEPGWQATAWFIERQYPKGFSRPEVQLQYMIVENATERESESKRVRDWITEKAPKIRAMVGEASDDQRSWPERFPESLTSRH
jgi:hypothetical protein